MYGRNPKEIRSSQTWRLRPRVNVSCHSSSPEGPEAGRDGGLGAKANEAGEREEQWEEADCKRWGCCPQVKDRLVPHRWGFHPRDGRCDGLNVRDPSPQVYMLNPNLQR